MALILAFTLLPTKPALPPAALCPAALHPTAFTLLPYLPFTLPLLCNFPSLLSALTLAVSILLRAFAGGVLAAALKWAHRPGCSHRRRGDGLQPQNEQGAARRHPCPGLVHCSRRFQRKACFLLYCSSMMMPAYFEEATVSASQIPCLLAATPGNSEAV